MVISRRKALKNCFFFTVGVALVPACMHDKSKSGLRFSHLQLNGNQEALVTELSETILPKTDTPGAKDTYTNLFVLKMLDDMYTEEEQKGFLEGMEKLNERADNKFDKSFVDATPVQRGELLKEIIADPSFADATDDLSTFLKTVKKLTVQGYMTSQYYLTNVRIYKLVPGVYHGCVPVASLGDKGPEI